MGRLENAQDAPSTYEYAQSFETLVNAYATLVNACACACATRTLSNRPETPARLPITSRPFVSFVDLPHFGMHPIARARLTD